MTDLVRTTTSRGNGRPTSAIGMRGRRAQAGGLVASLAVVTAVAAVGGLWTDTGPRSWYASLEQPVWNPPDVVFGPVWTALYLAMAIAAWLVWRSPDRPRARRLALGVYAVQLALNLGWTGVFFGLERPGWALLEISVLALSIAATIASFWSLHRVAAALLLPYLGWVAFAASINAGVVILN